jgi:hypothetical protein
MLYMRPAARSSRTESTIPSKQPYPRSTSMLLATTTRRVTPVTNQVQHYIGRKPFEMRGEIREIRTVTINVTYCGRQAGISLSAMKDSDFGAALDELLNCSRAYESRAADNQDSHLRSPNSPAVLRLRPVDLE